MKDTLKTQIIQAYANFTITSDQAEKELRNLGFIIEADLIKFTN